MKNSGWTLLTLKEYLEQRFKDRDSALDKAQAALEYRLEGMNEFQAQIDRDRSAYVTVEKHEQLDDRIDELRRTSVTNERVDGVVSRLEQRMWSYERWQNKMLGATALVVFVVPIISGIGTYLIVHHG